MTPSPPTTKTESTARKPWAEHAITEPDLAADPGPVLRAGRVPKPKRVRVLDPVRFAHHCVEAPIPCSFITGPVDGILRCVNVLCGNYGVMVVGIRVMCIGEWGTSKIAEALGMESNGGNGRVHRLTVLWRRVGWLRQGYGGEKTLPLLLSAGPG